MGNSDMDVRTLDDQLLKHLDVGIAAGEAIFDCELLEQALSCPLLLSNELWLPLEYDARPIESLLALESG